MTDRDSERTYAIKKRGACIHVTWEALGYAEYDFRPVHRQDRTGYYIRATDTFIADEDMPWELMPEDRDYLVSNYIFDELRQYGRRTLTAVVDKFLGERNICD